MFNFDEHVQREHDRIMSVSREDAIDYIAWRYRRTREEYRAHNMSDEEIERVATEQYEEILRKEE